MSKLTNLLTDKNVVAQDTTGTGGYNYYGFMSVKGVWVIVREKTDLTEYRYAVGNSSFDSNWTSRSSQIYEEPSGFPQA